MYTHTSIDLHNNKWRQKSLLLYTRYNFTNFLCMQFVNRCQIVQRRHPQFWVPGAKGKKKSALQSFDGAN